LDTNTDWQGNSGKYTLEKTLLGTMANLLQNQPGQDPLQVRRHSTFREYYGDASLDPSRADYSRILERLDPEAHPNILHVYLLEQAIGNSGNPQAYICCDNRQAQIKIFCVHLPTRYVGAMDGRVTPWDSLCFAYLGEITQGQVIIVNLPDNAFHVVAHVRAKSNDYIVQHLEDLGAYGLDPVIAAEPDSTVINTRAMMYLPPHYASLLLNPSGYTLQQTWDILYPALVEANDLDRCAPLIKWLRIVSMGVELPNLEQGSTPAVTALQVPLADGDLIHHRTRLLQQVLPGLYQPADTLERAITQIAVAVAQNTNDNRQACAEKVARSASPKLPSEKFTATIGILQDFLLTPNEADLPALWHHWANCTKRQEFNVLSEQLHAYTRSQDAFGSCAPIASVKLVQDLLSFTFIGESSDDIKTGLQPFVIADGSSEHCQANLDLAPTYGLLNAGEQSLMLVDLEALKAKEVQAIPLTYFEFERNLSMFGNLLRTVLRTRHVLTKKYREFWVLLSQGYRLELQHIIDNKHYIKPAHILRSLQLICFNWFFHLMCKTNPSST
jgi:hypothetical protein